eukprot:s2827_g2.t1
MRTTARARTAKQPCESISSHHCDCSLMPAIPGPHLPVLPFVFLASFLDFFLPSFLASFLPSLKPLCRLWIFIALSFFLAPSFFDPPNFLPAKNTQRKTVIKLSNKQVLCFKKLSVCSTSHACNKTWIVNMLKRVV